MKKNRTWGTGAIRNSAEGKGRYDLLSPHGIFRVARRLEEGAKTYGERNWEKGIPISSFIDSALRHIFNFMEGEVSEDHLAAAAWNILAAMHTEDLIRRGVLPNEYGWNANHR